MFICLAVFISNGENLHITYFDKKQYIVVIAQYGCHILQYIVLWFIPVVTAYCFVTVNYEFKCKYIP